MMPPLRQRIAAAIAEFNERHPGQDTRITAQEVHLSNRGRGPGLSAYVMTACGIGFEVRLDLGQEECSRSTNA